MHSALLKNVQHQTVLYQRKGCIHEVEVVTADLRRLCYFPVGMVRSSKKPNKIRIEWGAAVTVDGVSLNIAGT